MGFLDSYLSKYRLDTITDKAKSSLEKVEKDIEKMLEQNDKNPAFEQSVQKFGPQIADIVERFSAHFANLDGWSFSTVAKSLRFVMNIGTEVWQIVDSVSDLVVTSDMTPGQAHDAKVEFGQHLTYFVWSTVDPLKDRFSWIPFKKSIEKKLVFWVAEMALEHTVDLFAANKISASDGLSGATFGLMSVGSNFKAIP